MPEVSCDLASIVREGAAASRSQIAPQPPRYTIFMHAAQGHRIDDRRFGLRTTLAGAVHTGRYLDADAEAVTPDFAN